MTNPPAEGAAARQGGPRRGGRRRGITGRALVLGAVLILLVVVLASPVHRYLATRSALSQAEQAAPGQPSRTRPAPETSRAME